MRLRESMRLAAATPERGNEYAVATRRRDELGEMITAHNAMLGRVVDSIRRDRELAEERERVLARNDAVTAMPNRRAFLEHLSRRRAGAGSITVCLANVVQLRQINAAYGQQAGDAILREVGARLQRAAGSGTFVAHLGAGRFAVARRAGEAAFDPAAFAERLMREVAGDYPAGDDAATVALRVGISQAPFAELAPEELLNQAELALARTGAEDSCGYAFFEDSMAQAARERQALARALERALARDDELQLVFQAKASIAGRELALAGCEALLRWRHPQRGPVRPDVFIPIAETTGLVLPLGERVLRCACRQIGEWRARHGRSPRVAVNLSAHQFAAPGLLALVERALADGGVPGELLELEITESSAMRDVRHTAQTLEALRALGVRVSIDDFGTGHSSLNHLRRLPLDAIKIDKSFVDDIGRDPSADAICAAIVGMAHALGRAAVAEGVETEAQLDFLRRRGCDEIQGYLFARPEPAEAFAQRFLTAPVRNTAGAGSLAG
ncbi:MAG: putative bifunctional diguanylate cyclase/phosphodiesterase [Betaproteobacteria bacterium]